MQSIIDFLINLLAFVFSLGLIVAIHELGHLIFAKRANILCFEYAIGMGPAIYKKKGKETDFAIRAIPIGGFVSMAGESFEDAFVKKDMVVGLNFIDDQVSEIVLNKHLPHQKKMTVEAFELYAKDGEDLFISGYVDGILESYTVLENARYKLTEEKEQQIAPYHRSFESKRYLPKLLTLLAGPVFNFILAFLLFFVVISFTGKPQNSNVLGKVGENTPAASVGLNKGDKVVSVGGFDVSDWASLSSSIKALDSYENVEITYIKKGETITSTTQLDFRVDVTQLGISNITLAGVKKNPLGAEIGTVFGKTLEEKKLESGDIITAVVYNDVETVISNWADLTKLTETLDGGSARVTFLRNGESKTVYITVWEKQVLNSQGVSLYSASMGIQPSYKYDFLYSLTQPFKEVFNAFYSIIRVVGFLFGGSKQIGLGDLSGPIGIFNIVGMFARNGLLSLLSFIAFLSVNVGIINLLPIPALDGGRVLFISIEAVTRKKIPRKVDVLVNNIFFILLLLLFVFITFNDVLRLF